MKVTMKLKVLGAASFSLVALTLFPASAIACTCVILNDTCRPLATATAIFEATVESIQFAAPSKTTGNFMAGAASSTMLSNQVRLISVRDLKLWRGAAPKTIVTALDSAACGYDFKIGTRYLIVGERDGDDTVVVTRCGLTRPLTEAQGLLNYLDNATRTSVWPMMVWGEVKRASRWTDFEREYVPVSAARVTLKGPVERSVVTGQDGRYVATDLQPGRYSIILTPPPGAPELLADRRLEEVTLAAEPARACSEIDLFFSIASEISGVVTDELGVPQRGVFLSLRLADQRDLSRGAAGQGYTTDKDGRYRFNNLPPGRYQMFLNPESLPGTPGAPIIVLALGEKITLEPLRIRR
jgi:hypothetical protein